MGYRMIVVGTDGSPTATIARDVALRFAKRCHARLVVVTAYEPPRISRPMAESLLRHAAEAARREGVEAAFEVAEADPAELILDVAAQYEADLLVLGNKGMGQATRFKLGSVPDRIAHFAPCDLLIVETSKHPNRPRSNRLYRKLVAATDGSPTAGEAARTAFELAVLMRGEVTLVFVGDPIVGAIMLEETASSRPEGVWTEPAIQEGDPAEQICLVAEREGADLIVVGNKGMSGARRFLLGSVPNKVAHDAPTDVLIVKTVDRSISDIAPGHAGVVDADGKRVAVYRDEEGIFHTVSPKCTHMGCTVDWNDGDKTWDCPCHGSRYSLDGEVIQGPAIHALLKMEIPGIATPGLREPAKRRGLGRLRRKPERIVIVGASMAGASAATTLRQEGFDGEVVLIGAERHLPYSRPPLSKTFLRGETPFEDALVEPEAAYQALDIELRLDTTATSIEPGSKVVLLSGGERVEYDKVLVATGARNRWFPIPGRELEGVFDLRTVDDAIRIKNAVAEAPSVVIGGMGFIGSEVAASLRQKGLAVSAVDGKSVPLERVLGPQVGSVLAAIHREHGVAITPLDRVAAFEGSGRVERVVTQSGVRLDCAVAIVGLGVEPVIDVVQGSGVEIDDGILVDELCRTNVEGIFAAGDVANHYHPVYGRRVRVEHWQNALKHGRAAALSMLGKGSPYREIHWFWSDQYDHNLQYVGYHTEWDDLVVRGSLEDQSFLAFYMREGRVQSAVALNRGEELRQAVPLIESGALVDRARLQDEGVDLLAPV